MDAKGQTDTKAGWTPSEWPGLVGTSRSQMYKDMKAGRVRYVKNGHRTIITTPPREYIAALQAEQANTEAA